MSKHVPDLFLFVSFAEFAQLSSLLYSNLTAPGTDPTYTPSVRILCFLSKPNADKYYPADFNIYSTPQLYRKFYKTPRE